MQTLFLLLAIALTLSWILVAVSGPHKIDLPRVIAVLRYGSLLRTVALVLALAPPCVMAYAMSAFAWRNQTMVIVGGVSFFLTSLIAGLLLLETEAGQIVVTEDSVSRFSPWTGILTLKWDEVQRIDYSALNQWFVVSAANRVIRVSCLLVDVRLFVQTAQQKLPSGRYAGAVAKFAKMGKPV